MVAQPSCQCEKHLVDVWNRQGQRPKFSQDCCRRHQPTAAEQFGQHYPGGSLSSGQRQAGTGVLSAEQPPSATGVAVEGCGNGQGMPTRSATLCFRGLRGALYPAWSQRP